MFQVLTMLNACFSILSKTTLAGRISLMAPQACPLITSREVDRRKGERRTTMKARRGGGIKENLFLILPRHEFPVWVNSLCLEIPSEMLDSRHNGVEPLLPEIQSLASALLPIPGIIVHQNTAGLSSVPNKARKKKVAKKQR